MFRAEVRSIHVMKAAGGIGRDGGDDLEQPYPQILSFHTRRVWQKKIHYFFFHMKLLEIHFILKMAQ